MVKKLGCPQIVTILLPWLILIQTTLQNFILLEVDKQIFNIIFT